MAETGGPKSSNTMRSGVFISYARSDGEEYAARLRALLEAEGLPLWQDRVRMEGGRDWWRQIAEAIEGAEFMVLVMTPAALRSEVVRKEWRHARRQGVCVYPVKGAHGLDFASLPRWMRDAHWYELGTLEGERRGPEWPKFLADLRAQCETPRVPFMALDLPQDFVARPAEFEQLAALLLDREREEPRAVTAAVVGAGGYGKTTLALAICHSPEIQEAFDEGVLWVTLGQKPDDATPRAEGLNLTSRVEDLILTLSGARPGFASVEAATARLVELLADRDLLVVIDDVWDNAQLWPFTQGGPRCARLITTRNHDALPRGVLLVDVDAMRQNEAVALLGAGLPPGSEDGLRALAGRLGEWPLLLTLANGTLRRRCDRQPLPDVLAYVNNALDRRGLTAFDARDAKARDDARDAKARARAVAVTLGVSFDQLSEDERARFGELSVFPEDVDVPLPTLARLWGATGGFDEFDTEELCGRLHGLSLLLRFDPDARTVRLHDVVRAYIIRQQGDNLRALHRQLLDAHREESLPAGAHGWADLPHKEPYLWDHLAYHLREAARADELLATAKDLRYLCAKIFLRKSHAAEADLLAAEDLHPADAELGLLRRAVVQAAHLLNRCETLDDLKANLYCRLFDLEELSALAETLAPALRKPYLVPFRPLPDAPHPALVRTLARHAGKINDCAFGPDGSFVVAALDDGTLKVLDAQSGRELHTLRGHANRVNACEVSPDGSRIVSASDDRTLKVWDARSGDETLTIDGRHEGAVNDCAFSPDGTSVVSVSFDRTVRVWDAATGRERLKLEGHAANIGSCAVGPDGSFIVSASYDGIVRVWDAATGSDRLTIDCQSSARACAVSHDGSLVAVNAGVYSIAVWNITTGERLFELAGHEGNVTDCAFGPDGTFIVSASDDGAVKVWDVEEARERATFAGHTAWVSCCAVSRDGRFILSGDDAGGLKLWDARGSGGYQPYLGHWAFSASCSVGDDGSLAAYTSGGVLHMFDVEAGSPLPAPLHSGEDLYGCAVSPDGALVATVTDDKADLWDTDGGKRATLWENDWRLYCCAFSADGALVLTGTDGGSLHLWNAVTGKKGLYIWAHRKAIYDCAFSPDGSFVVSASDDATLKVWDTADGKERLTLAGHEGPVLGCAVSADGSLVVSASKDGTAKVWDARSGAEVVSFVGHKADVTGCALSTDGAVLVTSSRDLTLKVWDAATGECLHTFQAEGPLDDCQFFADGERLVAVGDGGLYVLRLVR